MADEEKQFKWLDYKLLKNCIDEATNHPSRQEFMRSHKRAWTYYKLTNTSMRPNGDDDIELDQTELYQIAFQNDIAKNVDNIISTGLSNYPIMRHYPQSERPQDGDLANNMDHITEAVWRPDGANLANLIQTVWKETVIGGLGIGKEYWDASNQIMGDGQIAGVKVPHCEVLIDPYALNDKRLLDARYIIHVTKHSKGYVRARYGYKGKLALGEQKGSGIEPTGRFGGWSRFKNYMREELINPLFGGSGATGIDPDAKVESDLVEIYECWLSPLISSDSNLVSGAPLEKQGENWIVATLINETIVKVQENPYSQTYSEAEMQLGEDGLPTSVTTDHPIGIKRHPFFCMYWQPTADADGRNRVYCCKGAVEPMIPVQVSVDALRTVIQKNALTTVNPWFEIMKDGVENFSTDMMQMKPGQIFVNKPNVTRGQPAIRLIEGANLPSYIFAMLEMKLRALTEVGSLSELMTGLGSTPQMGTSHTTGSVMAGAQQAALRPLVTSLIELDRGIYDMACIAEGLMQIYYKEDRFLNVSNQGKQLAIKWEKAYLTTNFIRVVVGGSTTPINDLTKQQDVVAIHSIVSSALMANDKFVLESVVLTLKNMDKPFTFDWIQMLQKKIMELEQLQEEAVVMGQRLGAQEAQAQQNQQNPQDIGEKPDYEAALAEINGGQGQQ